MRSGVEPIAPRQQPGRRSGQKVQAEPHAIVRVALGHHVPQ
ncbi:Uncharacterised protein [Mycobacteroides abscessus subsp. abscessus]|nr:Uncharacterised protein [Mycobacteroides abscessus subsp. abscessus]